MLRRHGLACLGATLLAPWAAAQAPAAIDDTWVDPRRQRSLPLRQRWPAGDDPCAAIVFSHGLGGSREGADVWGRAWAQAGLAVLHVQHPGSDTDALRDGRAGLRNAIRPEQLVERTADMRFVIDEIERRARAGQAPFTRVRLDTLGAAGHSFGAQTVQALAGQRLPVSAPHLQEPRLRAFVAFSPAPGRRGNATLQEQFGLIERAFLVVTGSLDGDPLASVGGVLGAGGEPLNAERRAAVFDGLPAGRRALLWLDGADHMSFAGNGEQRLTARRGLLARETVAVEREAAHHGLVARITSAWWRAQLLDDALALAALRSPQGLGAGDRWRID